jgi:hypothetical protein
MREIHLTSTPEWTAYPGLAQRLVGLFNRSAAMGLLSGPVVTRLEPASIQSLVADLQQHGLAGAAGVGLAPLMRPQQTAWDSATEQALEQRLDQMAQALEDSPTPATEWPAMRSVFGDELLAALLRLSGSSLRRYAAGERPTPDAVAGRLHWLAMVAGDLAGAYNHAGMRRWFERPRAQLGGSNPDAALGPDWHPDGTGAVQVRALAAALSGAQPLAV